jgi:GTP pyrophosphokinase
MISKTALQPFSNQTLDEWVVILSEGFDQEAGAVIRQALQVVIQLENINPVMPRGIEVAAILKTLGVDPATITAAILSDGRLTEQQDIEQQFGTEVAVLVDSIHRLNSFKEYSPEMLDIPGQAEILRRMLLAMVKDVRAVTIKLAYRLQRLRNIPTESYEVRKYITRETLDIYSPLANRLGIAQLKWELEDLAFRYLQPQIYLQIAKSLAENRLYREEYIEQFKEQLRAALEKENIQAEISGRPKHIYSIWRKMQRKQVDLNELYDIRAVRVITDNIASCYETLGLAHGLWEYLPKEFDDYIANPKGNGYQSLHTVVIGPEGAIVEIQIRTTEMHEFAELGVAAHWRYKEGGEHDAAVEKSILYLRTLLDNKADKQNLLTGFHTEMYADRIFVLTPRGQLKDLVKGATPLDFAYAVHTEVGNRCRGAKVDGRIVPLTYQLQSGERVEILTAKEGSPSPSWMDPQQGYLKSSHAIGKVRAWFKQQNHEKNLLDGKALLEQERQRLELEAIDLGELTRHFRLNRQEDLLIKLGRGDISQLQLSGALEVAPKEEERLPLKKGPAIKTEESADVSVQGVGNILTHFARCCKPVPGDSIVGYITQTKGVSIHRQQCRNILCLSAEHQRRLIDVSWGDESQVFPARIFVQAYDRPGLLGDITQIINHAKSNILEVNSRIDPQGLSVTIVITIAIRDTAHLTGILEKISQLNNVLEARRN